MLRTALKGLLAHKLRLFRTAFAVTLGVALMAGTLVLTDTMKQTFDDLFANVYRGTDAVVRTTAAFEGPQGTGLQRGRVPEALLAKVRDVPGVAVAEGSVFGYARIIGKNGKALGDPANGAPTFGTAWSDNRDLNYFRLVDGRPPRAADEIVIDRKSSTDGKLHVGDWTTVLVQGPPQRVRVAGIAKFGTADSPGGASCAVFTLAAAQRLIAAPGQFDGISVVGQPGLSQAQLVTRIQAVLPAGTEAVTGKAITKENQDQMGKMLTFFDTFLIIFAVVALLVGGFMMFNAFAITVAQRTRENGLLRALGASRRQVLTAVLIEAAAVGIIASLAGLVAGVGVAIGLKSLMGALGIEIPTSTVVISSQSMVIAFVIGMVVTVGSAVSPARKAAKVPPIAAMQLGVAGSTGYGSRQRVYVGAAVLLGGVAALFVGMFTDVPQALAVVGAGALMVFFGVSILARTISLPLSRFIGWPVRRTRGVTGDLARENAMRNPKRTAASASALMIGVAVVGLITIFVSSIKSSVEHSIDKTFTGDVIVDSGGGIMGGVDPAVSRQLSRLPEVQVAAGLRWGLAKVDGKGVMVQAGSTTLMQLMNVSTKAGSPDALGVNGLGVYQKLADDKNWRVGSPVDVVFAKTGHRAMRIAFIYGDNTQLGNYYMDVRAYEANFATQFDHEVFVKKAPGVSTPAAVAAMKQVTGAYPSVKVLTRGQYVDQQMTALNRLLALVYVLLALAILIALLGIANTLMLSISERIREIGLLRAVGMTRRQLRSMIRWESVIIALQGTILGLVIGVFFGWVFVTAMKDQGITQFDVPVGSLLVIVLIAGIAGMLAAVSPSRHAAKLEVLRAVVSD